MRDMERYSDAAARMTTNEDVLQVYDPENWTPGDIFWVTRTGEPMQATAVLEDAIRIRRLEGYTPCDVHMGDELTVTGRLPLPPTSPSAQA